MISRFATSQGQARSTCDPRSDVREKVFSPLAGAESRGFIEKSEGEWGHSRDMAKLCPHSSLTCASLTARPASIGNSFCKWSCQGRTVGQLHALRAYNGESDLSLLRRDDGRYSQPIPVKPISHPDSSCTPRRSPETTRDLRRHVFWFTLDPPARSCSAMPPPETLPRCAHAPFSCSVHCCPAVTSRSAMSTKRASE
jgi:hypothetical protein